MSHPIAGSVSTVCSPSPLPKVLTHQLIAYIGNKRRLLPFLDPIICGLRNGGDSTLLDPFCGSGAVARLARFRGYRVAASDWEPYAQVVTAAYLENTNDDVELLFARYGGRREVIDDLNRCGRSGSPGARGYIARHYAPALTDSPILGRERLFYSAENARFIDNVRNRIDEMYRPNQSVMGERARRVLLALLLYEASNHANTSGVFKAYHRGFGGHGRDALRRILAPMELEYPVVPDGPRGSAVCLDAAEFAPNASGDVAYLDPPYSTHQYGSNYFMLNTIAQWDKPNVDDSITAQGLLAKKAGIRPDWTETRSKYCSRATAVTTLTELLDRMDVHHIVLSYSTDGLISLEELSDLLSLHGSVSLQTHDYVVYRGGKQSIRRRTANREVVFVTTRQAKTNADRRSLSLLRRTLLEHQLAAVVTQSFSPARIQSEFAAEPAGVRLPGGPLIATPDCYQFALLPDVSDMSVAQIQEAIALFGRAACVDRREEIDIVVSLAIAAQAGGQEPASRTYLRRAVWCLRKFAHRKYRAEFEVALEKLRTVVSGLPDSFSVILSDLSEIGRVAQLRFDRS